MPSAKSSRSLGALLTSAGGARLTSYAIGLIGWIILAEIKDWVPGPWKVLNFLWAELT
jgi:hypothetical protein